MLSGVNRAALRFVTVLTRLRLDLIQSLWLGKRSDARDYAFAKFYTDIGKPTIHKSCTLKPNIKTRGLGVHFARFEEDTPVPRLVAQADGVTLKLGPGSGNQLPRFNPQSITRLYGLEPNTNFIKVLRTRIQHYPNLARSYVLVNASIEDQAALNLYGILEGSLDSVVCMQVLCLVHDPAAAARQIYKLLKPGGQLLFWEHQRSQDTIIRLMQSRSEHDGLSHHELTLRRSIESFIVPTY